VTIGPFASRRVVAEEEHAKGRGADEDEGNDESNAPGLRRRQALVQPQRVVDHGHEEVSDAAARVSPATDQGVGRSHDVFVEEAGLPDLTRHKGAAEDSDEEAQRDQAGYVLH